MKKGFKRLICLALAVCLLTGSVLALSETDITDKWTLPLADNVSLITSGMTLPAEKAGAGEGITREHILTYTPGDDVWPVVVYGDTLYGRSTMAETAKYLTDDGLSVVAAVNGSFFDMSTGIPYGLVVTDGVLRVVGGGYCVGFFEDGSAIIGDPQAQVTVAMPGGDALSVAYNRGMALTSGAIVYSADYDVKTKNTVSCYNVVLQPIDGSKGTLDVGGTVRVKVTGMIEATPSCPIPDGCFVLSVADKTNYQSALERLKQLKIDDELVIRTAIDRDWEDVRYACGGGDMLVTDGDVQHSFTLDSAGERRARTAVGLKKDGTLVLYTTDKALGADRSDGLTLDELAQRMKLEGCVTALNLDGGGSTAVGAQYPGYASCATVNTPGDGSLRPCANFIYFVRKQSISRQAARLHLYPYATPVLPGAKIAMTLKASDANYMAATVPSLPIYAAQNGTIDADGVLSVDKNALGEVKVTAGTGGLRAEVSLTVVGQVSEIDVMKENTASALKTLTVAAGSKTELKARARSDGRAVAAQDTCFTWQADENIGTIDASGTFTAARAAGKQSGVITVSYGDTKTEIAVTVAEADPFVDMKDHWAKTYVNEMYYDGVLAGAAGSDGQLRYRPDDSMTRQEFVVALMRFMKIDTGGYRNVELPFADTDKTADWALDAMKAAYALGYVGGSSSDGRLYGNPASTITRQEAMVILARSQQLSAPTDRTAISRFSDADLVADWAAGPLAAMIERNIIGGSNGKLNPTGKVTRAEVAKMLYALKYQS